MGAPRAKIENDRGFTLPELLTTIAILGILIAIAVVIFLALDRGEQQEGPDYYLIRLDEPYNPGDPRPTVNRRLPRNFPGNVKVANVITPTGSIVDNQGANYWVPPWDAPPPSPPVPQTR